METQRGLSDSCRQSEATTARPVLPLCGDRSSGRGTGLGSGLGVGIGLGEGIGTGAGVGLGDGVGVGLCARGEAIAVMRASGSGQLAVTAPTVPRRCPLTARRARCCS
jgi:hypothetical protein